MSHLGLRILNRWLTGLTCFLVLLLSGCASIPPVPKTTTRGDYEAIKQYLSAVILKDLSKYNVQGLSIALVDDQKVVWAKGFGYADVANRVPATADTIYRIGSISKVVTATEIMRLAEQGKVDLDRSVTDYVPEFYIRNRFPESKPITLRALLAHHSGLPSDLLKGMWLDNPASLTQYVSELRRESLASPPQSLYKYSNIDYSLLGKVIENVEHRGFSSAMRKDLLEPLGMAESSFRLTPEIEPNYARAYRQGKEAKRLSLRDVPAGSMLSSANDMSRWLRFIFAAGNARGVQIIKPETLNEMFEPQFAGIGLDFGHEMGLGWMLSGLSIPAGKTIAWHNGGFAPYQAHLSILPRQKLGVVILSNSDEASQFITRLGTRTLELAYEVKYGLAPLREQERKAPAPVRLSHETLARCAGHYVMFNGQLGSIDVDGDHLETSLFGRRFLLQPIGDDTFAVRASIAFGLLKLPIDGLSLQFQSVQGLDFAVLKGLPAPFAFERLPRTEIPGAWQKRIGNYQTTDTVGEQFDIRQAELTSVDGILVFKALIVPKNGMTPETRVTIALRAVSDQEAVIAGIGNGEGGVVRAFAPGGGTELVYSGFRFVRTAGR